MQITQNHILGWLEEVVPMMKTSSAPEDSLLKFAKDKNLPPEVLGRLCHMFNALKTNSVYNTAKTAADRGRAFELLDVPAILDKYANFEDELDYSKIERKFDFWDLGSGSQGSTKIKLASQTKVAGNIRDLYLLDELSANAGKFKEPDAVKTASDAADVETIDIVKYSGQKSRELQWAKDYAYQLVGKREAVENKFAKAYNVRINGPKLTFDMLEHEAVLSYQEPDRDAFKESLHKLASALKGKSSYLNSTVKTASDELYAQKPIAKAMPDCMEELIAYHESLQEIKIARAMIDSLEEEIQTLEGLRKSGETHVKVAASLITDPSEIALAWKNPKAFKQQQAKRQAREAAERRRREEQEMQKNIGTLARGMLDVKAQLKSLQSKPEPVAKGKQPEDILSAITGLGETSITGVRDSVFDTGKAVKALYEEFGNTPTGVNEKLPSLKNSLNEIDAKTNLETLLYTDPILSKLNDAETDNLLEVYNTIVNRNPSVATDMGLLRMVLRRAVQTQGIDVGAADALTRLGPGLKANATNGK